MPGPQVLSTKLEDFAEFGKRLEKVSGGRVTALGSSIVVSIAHKQRQSRMGACTGILSMVRLFDIPIGVYICVVDQRWVQCLIPSNTHNTD